VINRQGKKGTAYPAISNSIILECEKDFGMFEYDIRFRPALDAVRSRHGCLRLIADIIGTIRNYDGGETLYLPIQLNTNSISRTVNDPDKGINNVQIVLTFRRKRSLDECLHFYNVLFERVMEKLKYERIGRKYFDPLAPKLVPQHKLAGEKILS
jgi:aubergine-like protein